MIINLWIEFLDIYVLIIIYHIKNLDIYKLFVKFQVFYSIHYLILFINQ